MGSRFVSIRTKLQRIVFLATLTAVLFSLVGNIAGDIWVVRNDLLADLGAQAGVIETRAVPALRRHDAAALADSLANLHVNVTAVAIYDAQGALLARFPATGGAPLPFRALAGSEVAGDALVLTRAFDAGAARPALLRVAMPYDLTRTVVEDIEIAGVVALLALGVALLLIHRMASFVTQPISAVAGLVRAMVDDQDYARQVERRTNDEIGILVDAFNNMLDVVRVRTAALVASNAEYLRVAGEREQAQREVLRLNAALEQRVGERTAELEQSNRSLAAATAVAEVAKEVAEEASHAKSAFLSSMSHELRTPLNSILGFAQLLASEAQPDEYRMEFSGYILKAGNHLLTLINEILDLTKIESGKLNLLIETVAVAGLVRDCEAMMAPLAARTGVTLQLAAPAALCVRADRMRLKQVLLNLVTNAIKYNRPGGSVTLACDCDAAGRQRISVHDTGYGLDAAQLGALFQPFNRLGQEGGSVEGTGIGLVVSKRLVELMGASIAVASAPGRGSTFSITFGTAPVPAAAQGGATVLHIEDNADALDLVAALLRLAPEVRLLAAPDLARGAALAQAQAPRAILLDLDLPGMDGRAAVALLRAAQAQAQAVPIIAIGARVHAAGKQGGAADGFFRSLGKPIDIGAFWEAIDAALALSAPVPAELAERP